MKVLILRFSSIGDIVLTSPVPRVLKTQLDDVEVHYATMARFRFLLEENPYIDKIHVLEKGDKQLVETLKTENFDYVIDLHHNLRTLRIKWALKAKAYAVDKLNWQKYLMVNFKVNKLPNRHIVDRYLDTLQPLGAKPDQLGLDYFIPDKDEVDITWLPESHRNGFITYAIGGQHGTKKLPVKRMIELCDRINKPVILLGGKEDAEAGEEIARFFERTKNSSGYEESLKELGKKTEIFNGCGKFNFNQSASLVKQSSVVFSHDTGLMHVAAAFGKTVFSIWGNTIPSFGMYPYRTKFIVFENNKIKCRPCSKIGFDKCPKGHFKCMNDLVFDFYIP
ncbi:glycosyltransferase family 9 protein [uncultured Imperialibacter sp.]|uniref:glycosyltransferase family 9 protein n=1 Tax=uncultured Imperialibacter sp. TaxID=1672639 RepID=UPI0030DA49BD